MKDYSKHIVRENITIRKVLSFLNEIPLNPTLIVMNKDGRMVGTLTDGDVRRGLIGGCQLTQTIDMIMCRNFNYLEEGTDLRRVKEIKRKGVKLLPVLDKDRKIIKVYDLNKIKTVLPLDAVIMAGGRGERLRPLTDKLPKPLLEIDNKPIIEHTVNGLLEYGIENIHISIGYLGHMIKNYYGNGSSKGAKIDYISEPSPMGTIGSISRLGEIRNDSLLVVNSDLFTNIDYEDFYLRYVDKKADMAVASVPYSINIPYAVLERDGFNVKGLKEKPINTHYINAGIYIMRKKILKMIPNTFYNATDLMEAVIKNNMKLIHNSLIGYWIDIGKHGDYEKAQEIAKHIQS